MAASFITSNIAVQKALGFTFVPVSEKSEREEWARTNGETRVTTETKEIKGSEFTAVFVDGQFIRVYSQLRKDWMNVTLDQFRAA